MNSILEAATYIPAVRYCRDSRTPYCLMVETEDYELSGCYVKFTDYEELRSMYLGLQEQLERNDWRGNDE